MVGMSVGGILAGVALLLAIALALHLRRAADSVADLRGLVTGGLLAVPGAMVLYFSFSSGGFFPDATAFVALALILVLVLWTTLADEPFAAFGGALALAAGALALYTLWTLASALWSHAPSRALIEANRALVYLLTLVLFGALGRTSPRLGSILHGVTAAMVVVCLAGLLTRLLPEVFPAGAGYRTERLSHPLTYWNSLGLMAALAGIFCMHLTSSLREHPAVRVLAAGAGPVIVSTLFFTFSRGAIAAGVIGALLYVVLGRPRGLLTGLLAVVPASAVAVATAYRAEELATADPTSVAAVQQGHGVAVVVGACVLAAVLVRALLLVVDTRVLRLSLRPELGRRARAGAWAVGAACAVAVTVGLGIPDRIAEQAGRFADPTNTLHETDDPRDRLDSVSSNGRIEHWKVGMLGYDRAQLHGTGAGTYALLWAQERPERHAGFLVKDAHSLYIETLAELGVVGLALILATLAAILLALARLQSGADRGLYAALFAGTLAWAVHAGVDWDWEMPAITVWVFAVGGMALAHRAHRSSSGGVRHGFRVAVALAVLLMGVGPALMLVAENRLDRAVAAYERGDCDRAIEEATSAIAAVDVRPEPYEVVGFCQSRRGFHRLAAEALGRAVALDPDNWEFHYGLAVVRGAGGMDPVAAARAAQRLNPLDPVVVDLMKRAERRDPSRRLVAFRELRQDLSAVR